MKVPDPNRPSEYELPAAQRRIETDDGAFLAVTELGTGAAGPPVVLAHCWMGSRLVWAPVAHRLVRAGHRVVLYDQRGHGRSTLGTGEYTVDRLGGDLACVLEGCDAEDAIVAGHSMGAMTVMALLTRTGHPSHARIRGAVLAATAAAGLAEHLTARAERVVGSRLFDRVLLTRAGHLLSRGVVGRHACREHLVRWRDVMVATPADVRIACMRAMRAMDLVEGLERVRVPVHVVVGTHDRLTPKRFSQEIAARIPGARLEVLEWVGHTLPFEAADDLSRIIHGAAPAPSGLAPAVDEGADSA